MPVRPGPPTTWKPGNPWKGVSEIPNPSPRHKKPGYADRFEKRKFQRHPTKSK